MPVVSAGGYNGHYFFLTTEDDIKNARPAMLRGYTAKRDTKDTTARHSSLSSQPTISLSSFPFLRNFRFRLLP